MLECPMVQSSLLLVCLCLLPLASICHCVSHGELQDPIEQRLQEVAISGRALAFVSHAHVLGCALVLAIAFRGFSSLFPISVGCAFLVLLVLACESPSSFSPSQTACDSDQDRTSWSAHLLVRANRLYRSPKLYHLGSAGLEQES